jgi:Ca-activated chloride channel family protein
VRLEWPFALAALLVVPLALGGFAAIARRRARYAVHFTNLAVLAAVIPARSRVRTFGPAVCAGLALTCVLAAITRPEARVAVAREPATIVLAVDMSGSMAADDVRPTRLAAAEAAIRAFVSGLPKRDRVGLVTFSSTATVAAPLTRDRGMVLDALGFAAAPGQGTAIGDAIARSVELLVPPARGASRPAPDPAAPDTPPKAILLLSDGAQTRGRLSPTEGAALARSRHIRVYSVALGTPSGTITAGVISLRVPPDPVALRAIARTTGATFYAPESEMRLSDAYADIASRLGSAREWRELTFLLLGLAAVLALTAGALSAVWDARLP